MIKHLLFIILIVNTCLFGQDEKELISIVRVEKATVYNKNVLEEKNIVDYYPRGKVMQLEWCNDFDWCKVQDKELYISKVALGVMSIDKFKDNTSNVIKKLEDTITKDEQKQELDNKNTIKKDQVKVNKKECLKLKRIDLSENEIFDLETQDEYLSKYLYKCIDGKLIKEIINTVSSYYLDNGFITTKAYLQEQDITDGQIDISVLEGKVEDIIHSDTNSSSWKISTAFIGQKGETLNLRDLETSLEMINRVSSADSNFELKPGKQVGGSIVEIKTKKTFPVHLSIGMSGEECIKDNNPSLTGVITVDNLVGINDILTYTYNGSRIQEEYQSTKGEEVNYSFPLGSYLVELIRSDFSYRQGVDGINDRYLSNGDTIGTRFKLNKVVKRDQTNKYEVKFSIYHKNTKNYFMHELIEVSSYRTTLAQLDLIHTNYQSWGQNYTVYSLYQGKDWFGALSDIELNGETDYSDEAKLEFTKYSIDNTLYYYFKDRSYNFKSNFHIQYTKDYLYNNDQLTIGSDYTVRGYDSSNYYGNNGYYLKNDITKTFAINLQDNLLKDISFFIGLDGGYVKCESDNEGVCGELYGRAIGFSTSGDNFSSNFMWSRPIRSLSEEFEKETLFSFNMQINL